VNGATREALRGLDAEDYRARVVALYALGRLGDRDAAPRIAALLADGDYRVRMAALNALAALHDDTALPAVTALLHDREVLVRAAAAEALGASGDASALDPLIDRLLDASGENEHVRLAAASALEELGGPVALAALVAALRATRATLLRYELIRVVARRCEPGEPTVVEALLEALDDGDDDVRAMAAYALGTVGDARALPALEYAAANDYGEHTLLEEGGLYTSNCSTAERAIAAILARLAGATTAEEVEAARRRAPWRHRMPDYTGCRKIFVWERRGDGDDRDDGGATVPVGEAQGIVDRIRLQFHAPTYLSTITVTWCMGWRTARGLAEDAVPELYIPWEAWGALAHCGDLLARLGRAVGPAMQPAEFAQVLRDCGFEDRSG
jgi:HEAT repeats/PBS lyase HEAT-like repeat